MVVQETTATADVEGRGDGLEARAIERGGDQLVRQGIVDLRVETGGGVHPFRQQGWIVFPGSKSQRIYGGNVT